MLKEKMEKALNGQVNAELYSSYLYLAMSSWLHAKGLAGSAYWMKVQALEELYHAMKLFDYINGRGGRALTAAIEAPPSSWDSPLAVFEAVLAHEKKVTGLIKGLVRTAEELGDGEAKTFLAWFVKEQEEEEESAGEILKKFRKAGADLSGPDGELGARTFKIPADAVIKFRNPPNSGKPDRARGTTPAARS